MDDAKLLESLRAAAALAGEDEAFDEWRVAWLAGHGRQLARVGALQLRAWDFLRGVRCAAGEASPAFRRARARERLVSAALALATRKATEGRAALAEADEIIRRDEGEARDRTTVAE